MLALCFSFSICCSLQIHVTPLASLFLARYLLDSCAFTIVFPTFYVLFYWVSIVFNAGSDTAAAISMLVMVLLSTFYRSDASAYCSCCRRLNNFLSGWRLSPFYIALGVALLMWPNSLWLSSVVGIQLLILAILRLFTIFRYQSNTIKCESLLQKQPANREYFEK